jgi:hypothetical protein
MSRVLILRLFASLLALLATGAAFAQSETNQVFVAAGAVGGAFGGGIGKMNSAPVQGAPYSATITNESVQTLADGNRIVQKSTGTTARDSMGRTRQDAPLPMIANMAPADAPHLVFIQDPVAQASYTLNLTDKTASKGPAFGMAFAGPHLKDSAAGEAGAISIRGLARPSTAISVQPQMVTIQSKAFPDEGQVQSEDLGSKVMESVNVTGTRTTRTIPAGQIGNDKQISIVTEVWTSPDLKTVVYSKRSDPRMGDQTFQLTNIVRAEPDPALFTVPADFKVLDTPGPIMYKTSGGLAQ